MNHEIKLIIPIFFLMTCFYNAQCFNVLKAEHDVSAGGREESRMETISLFLKNNSKLEAKYLLVGSEKLEIEKSMTNEILTIKAVFFPYKTDDLQADLKTNTSIRKSNNFDLTDVFLVSENLRRRKIVKQKIKLMDSKKSNSNHLPIESPYQ